MSESLAHLREYDTYIFDLDGMILNTTFVWLPIFRESLERFGGTAPEDKELYTYTHDFREMHKLGLPLDQYDNFLKYIYSLAHEKLPDSEFYDGAEKALHLLHDAGKKLGIFTTMDRPILEPMMEHHSLDTVVSVAVAGTDVANRKPSPDGLLRALAGLSIQPDEYHHACYVGDKDTDMQTASNAGIDGILFYPPEHQELYDPKMLQNCSPVAVITHWDQLVAVLSNPKF